MINDVIIVGAGPAGLFAALAASGRFPQNSREKRTHEKKGVQNVPRKILLLEKNPTAGRKLLLAGGGRCNVTHEGEMRDFLPKYGAAERFVKPVLFEFSNTSLINFLAEEGVLCQTRDDGKIFPRSESARDVLSAILRATESAGVCIRYKNPVRDVEFLEEQFLFRVCTPETTYLSRTLILAVGGKSYPNTGATGDATFLAPKFNHSIRTLRPALTPVLVRNYALKNCSGISLRNVLITQWRDSKKIASRVGDVLFALNGLSGPGILDLSKGIQKNDVLTLSLAPDWTDRSLLDVLERHANKRLPAALALELNVAERLVSTLLRQKGLDERRCLEISRQERKTTLSIINMNPFVIQSLGDFRLAMVTTGGVVLEEINRQTMESRLRSGLFFCGEMLDVDGDTGGYNLQFAFSSGVAAGRGARRFLDV